MNTRRLILVGAVSFILFLSATAQAQYSARRLTRRIAPQQVPHAPTNAPAVQQQAPPAAPTPAAPATSVQAPPHPVTVVRPAIDPEETKAAREKADKKALEFQKKRAEEGSDSAQYELGIRYLKGDGVVKDDATARKWLTMSSKSGYGPAKRKLEELDKTGDQPPANVKAVKTEPLDGQKK